MLHQKPEIKMLQPAMDQKLVEQIPEQAMEQILLEEVRRTDARAGNGAEYSGSL